MHAQRFLERGYPPLGVGECPERLERGLSSFRSRSHPGKEGRSHTPPAKPALRTVFETCLYAGNKGRSAINAIRLWLTGVNRMLTKRGSSQ
jgi:hypothetical protein